MEKKGGGERCVRVSARLYEWSVRTEGGGHERKERGRGEWKNKP